MFYKVVWFWCLKKEKRDLGLGLDNNIVYCLPPKAPNIANRAKNRATGKIPITVQAVSFAFSHSVLPCPVGQMIASDTSEKMRIPIKRATAAPMNARINPSDSTILLITTPSAYLKEKFDV